MVSRKERRETQRRILREKAEKYNEELSALGKDKNSFFLLKVERPTHVQPPYVSKASTAALVKSLSKHGVPKELVAGFCDAVNQRLEEQWHHYQDLQSHAHHRRKHRLRKSQGMALALAGACTVWFAVGIIPLIIGVNMVNDNNVLYSGVRSDFVLDLLREVIDHFRPHFNERRVSIGFPQGLTAANFNAVSSYDWEFYIRFHLCATAEQAALEQESSEVLPPKTPVASYPDDGATGDASFSSPTSLAEDDWSEASEIEAIEITSEFVTPELSPDMCEEDALVTDSVAQRESSPAAVCAA